MSGSGRLQVMAERRILRSVGLPRTRPEAVLADNACSSRDRPNLRRLGIRTVIPRLSDQIAERERRERPAQPA